MKLIELSQGKFAMVDDEDFERVSKHKWSLEKRTNTFYGRTNISKVKKIFLHRFILNIEDKSILVDHIDHNGLNNVRSNLRFCNFSQNASNRIKSIGLSSKFKGVVWDKEKLKWKSQISFNDKTYHLGYFDIEIKAAIAYNNAALTNFGEFAHLNIIEQYGEGTQTALEI